MAITHLQYAVSEATALAVAESLDELIQYSQTSYSIAMLNDKYWSLLLNTCIKYDNNFDCADTYKSTLESGINLPSDQFILVSTMACASPSPDCHHPGPPCGPPSGTVFLHPDIYKLLSHQDVKDCIIAYNSNVCISSSLSTHAPISFSEENPDDHLDANDHPDETTSPASNDIHPKPDVFIINDDNISHMIQATNSNSLVTTIPLATGTSKWLTITTLPMLKPHALVLWSTVVSMVALPVLMSVLSCSTCKISVTGIGNHELSNLDIVRCAGIISTNHSCVILIVNEYAYYGQGNSIPSAGQIEWYKNQVDDKSVTIGGTQCITFLDGYTTPLECCNGLPQHHCQTYQ